MTDLGSFNLHRANLVIETLLAQGVKYFCLSPGSRSTPLMLAISKLPKELICVHFDERGLGFHALGFAKASNSPVAILVTTGTAVANLLPAVAEASASKIPLIILSADRPPELRDCGANQTMDQVALFKPFTKWDVDLAFSDPLASDAYLISSIAYAANQSRKGPVQVNCMIREPLFSLEEEECKKNPKKLNNPSCFYEPVISLPPMSSFKNWAEILMSYEKGIILLGEGAIENNPSPLLALAKKLGWPIFSSVLSGGRQIGTHPFHMEYPDLFLKANPDVKADVVLQIGGSIVSKTVTKWISSQKDLLHFLVTDHPSRQDPEHNISYRMECTGELFCHVLDGFVQVRQTPWISFWKTGSEIIKKELSSFFLSNNKFSEPALLYFLKDVPYLFLSNSMPIRDADLFNVGSLFASANRGISGIDGNIATATGIATALKKPLVAVLGDLASLHDLNSLALLKKSSTPIFFIIINNQGGGIFSFLPISEQTEIFEELVATAHEYSFEFIAKTFSLPFYEADSLEAWETAWEKALQQNTSCIIECHTKREDNVSNHEEIYTRIKASLCSSPLPLESLMISP